MSELRCPDCGRPAEESERDGAVVGVCHECRLRFPLDDSDRDDRRIEKRRRKRKTVQREKGPYRRQEVPQLSELIPIEVNLQINICVVIAILVNIVGWRALIRGYILQGLALGFLALLFFVWATIAFGERKGYPWVLGLSLGLGLSLVGLGIFAPIIIFILPDNSRD